MKVVLSIAGSDSSGGAGIQADIKSGEYHGVFMTTALTAVTAQNTTGVKGISPISSDFLNLQIKSILDDFDVRAVKIGMIGNVESINIVKEVVKNLNIPIVLDPVAISRAGSKLIDDKTIKYLESLFEYATLITPNKYEAKEFFNVQSVEDILSCNNYGTNILFKNIENNDDYCIDILKTDEGKLEYFQTAKAKEYNTHGTGCSFSSSIASLLALEKDLRTAIESSKKYIYSAIDKAPNLGKGNGPINYSLQ